MAGIRVIAKATDRIAKFREAKKMVRMSCDAASQREPSFHQPSYAEPASKNTHCCCLAMVHLALNRCSFSIMAYGRAKLHIA